MPDILGIGSSGLAAYRKLLETVGSNIVNANTQGYVRRDVMLSGTGDSSMLPTARASTSGSGVLVDSVRRGSDTFLQAQAFNANASNKQAQTLADSLNQLEKSIFASNGNVSTVVQDFHNQFADLANSPASTTVRLTLIDSGQRVSEMFRTTANSISTSLQSVDAAIDVAVNQINNLASQLARLNDDIRRTSAGNQKANDLLDQRDTLLQQMSELTSFTFVEEKSGAIDLYLGDTATGEKLINAQGSRQLGIIKANGRFDIAFDPYLNPSTTSQIRSGTIAGLLDFRREATKLMQDVNRLAVGFATSINSQHMQGIDQDGRSGKALFSTDGLKAKAAGSNTGNANMSLSISAAASLTGATYTARYNASESLWTISSSNGQSAKGASQILMDGVTFSFEGAAKNNDTFVAEPLTGAASSLRFLRRTPSEIAAALPLYVDPANSNQGTGELAINRRDTPIASIDLPSAADIFSQIGSGGADFLRSGAAFYLPAGTQSAKLTSLATLSTLRFSASASEIASLARDGASEKGLSLSLTVDVGTTDETSVKLDIYPAGATLEDMASAVNTAARRAGLSDKFTALVSGGALSISALGAHAVSTGAFTGVTASGAQIQLAATDQAASAASPLRLFTREGRQLTGPAMTASEAAAFITVANGFLSEAKYLAPSSTSNYRSLAIGTTTRLIDVDTSTQGQATIDVAADPSFNQSQSSAGLSPGAIYALDVNGLPGIRIAGDELGMMGETAIAERLEQRLNEFATRRSWTGTQTSLATTGNAVLQFKVTLDGEEHQVTFRRAKDADGVPLNHGVFETSGPLPLEISLVDASPSGTRVMITLPQQLRTDAPAISITADSTTATALGLSATPANTNLSAAADLVASLLSAKRPELKVTGGTIGAQTLIIDAPTGRSGDVSWTMSDGKLLLSSSDASLSIVTTTTADQEAAEALGLTGTETLDAYGRLTASNNLADALLASAPVAVALTNGTTLNIDATSGQSGSVSWSMVGGRLMLSGTASTLAISATSTTERDNAAALGFLGTDLALTRTGNRLSLTSTANDTSRTLADGSASVSIASNSIDIDDVIPEDMIVALADPGANGLRRISASLGADIDAPVELPNIKVKILSGTQLEIIDAASGISLANRAWKPDEPISYLGLTFTMTGAAANGDIFNIVNDPTRTGDNRNAMRISELATKSVFGPKQGTFQDVYTSVAATLGSTVSSAATFATAAKQQASDLRSAYESKTGVNLDSEASDLIRYQQAYQAAAQIVSTAREMFQTILNSF